MCLLILIAAGTTHAYVHTILSNTTIEEYDNTYENIGLIIGDGTTSVTVIMNGQHQFQALTITNMATLTHSETTTTSICSVQLTITENLMIENGGNLNVNGKGYQGGYKSGNDSEYGRTINNTNGSKQTSGGSYGGTGGGDYACDMYGDISKPIYPGSGGGAANIYQHGGDGGGQIKLIVLGKLTNNGVISSNGLFGQGGAGAGSGGSIYLTSAIFSGNGIITANGGTGERSGGGGGRIAIYYTSNDYSGTIQAYGGSKGVDSEENGGSGTIFLKSTDQPFGEIILDNNQLTPGNANTSIPSNYTTFDGMIIDHAARATASGLSELNVPLTINNSAQLFAPYLKRLPDLSILNSGQLTAPLVSVDIMTMNKGKYIDYSDINQLSIASSLTLTHNSMITHYDTSGSKVYALDIHINGDLIIDESSQINVNGKGYLGAYQSGNDSEYGRTINNTNGSKQTSGGSYGGTGGGDYACDMYGDISKPIYPGSGGGAANIYQHGGDGGGQIKLIVLGKLTNNGVISSNGLFGQGGAGAGSGGSIYLTSAIFSGNGIITANGGTGERSGGGGGRIAIYYTSNDYSGTIQAYGGSKGVDSEKNGGAGTIYLKPMDQQFGELIIDNNNLIPPNNSTSVPSDYTTFNNFVIENGARVLANGLRELPVPLILDNNTLLSSSSLTVMPMLTIQNSSQLTAPLAHLYTMIINNGQYIHYSNTPLTIESSLSLTNNAILSHTDTTSSKVFSLKLAINGDLSIDPTSQINVNGKGYLGGYQPGNDSRYGRTIGNTTTDGSFDTSGGSYGGLGGDIYACSVYGDYKNPVYPGSGGGSANIYQHGGDGGGYIQLMVSGNINHHGIISANGLGGTGGSGSGSGGSIQISATNLSGSGIISANGGTGDRSGGGGGRIALNYEMSDFSGILMTDGGKKGEAGFDGLDGTLFLNGETALPLSCTIDSNLYLSSSGKLTVSINGQNPGIDYPFVTTTGEAYLGGKLLVSLSPVFLPIIGDRYNFITAQSIIRQFDSVELPSLSHDKRWVMTYRNSVSLEVAGVNQPPVISTGQSLTINEYSPLGTIVGQVQATDMENDPISYSIITGLPQQPFVIDPLNGYIQVNDKLLFENSDRYTLTVMVSDPYTSTSENIVIKVIDQSDIVLSDLLLVIDKFSSSAVAGEFIDYHIQCVQNGPSDADQISLTFFANPSFYSVIYSLDQGANWQETSDMIPIGEMTQNSSNIVLIKGRIQPDYDGTIETEFHISSDKNDPYPHDNMAFLVTSSLWPAPTIEITTNREISTVDSSLDGNHVIIGNGSDSVEFIISGEHRFASITIRNNATITHPSNHDQTKLIIYDYMIVDEGGQFNVNAKGYAPGTGPGYGGDLTGGTYGGKGGIKNVTTIPDTYGSSMYPTDLGSGGGGYGSGGAGGGMIYIEINNMLTINGSLSANGENAGSWCGGGSGGSIYIKAGQFSGEGTILANGGQAGAGGSGNNPSGGGGGRIAIHFNENLFNGSITALGGLGVPNGNPGTIGLFDKDDLVFIAGHSWRFETIDAPKDHTFHFSKAKFIGTSLQPSQIQMNVNVSVDYLDMSCASLTIADTIHLTVNQLEMIDDTYLDAGPSSRLNISHLKASGRFEINSDLVILLDDLTIGANSIISANHKGFPALKGPGAGGDYGNGCGTGGSFGGLGGTKDANLDLSIYGSAVNPGSEGSGGGGSNGTGGAGGGLIRLLINHTLTIDGQISANGENATSWRGGGSGGSIYIKTNVLKGSGIISANGGNSGPGGSGSNPGGGGGGRIAIYYNENLFSGSISAYGGTGSPAGSSGTVGLFDQDDNAFIAGHSWHFQSSDAPVNGIFSYDHIRLSGESYNNQGQVYVDANLDTQLLIFENISTLISDHISITALHTQVLSNTYIEASPSAILSFSDLSTNSPYAIYANLSISVDSLTIGPQDIISANALGNSFHQGPGAGQDYGNGCGTGGSYGGRGGTKDTQVGLPTYGTEYLPLFQGSGGGGNNGSGGAGGGLIQLFVANTLTVDGILSVNGENATSWRGGGSGGGLYIQTHELNGTGTIQANGGASGPGGSGSNPGGGGGGRILVDYQTNNFAGTIESLGGNGSPAGEQGSYVMRNLSEADLIVNIPASFQIIAGGYLEYSMTLTNEGPGIASLVSFSLELPSWISAEYKLSTELTWKDLSSGIFLGDMNKGASITIYVRGSIDSNATGFFSLDINVTSNSPDSNQSNNQINFTIPIVIWSDLSISATCSLTRVTNDNELIYTITATNSGPSNASDVTITDDIPMSLKDVMFSTNGGLFWNEWTGQYVIKTLEKQKTIQLLIKGIVQSYNEQSIENIVFIESSAYDQKPSNNEYSVSTKILSPPTISGMQDCTVLEDHPAQIVFSAYDMNDLPCTMDFDVSLSDYDMIPFYKTLCHADTYTITLNPEKNRTGSLMVDFSVIDSDGLSASDSFEVTFIAVNDPPTFQLSSSILSVTNTGNSQTFSNWAKSINSGALDETNQSLWFDISFSNASLFEIWPQLNHEGTLTFRPVPAISGRSIVDVILKDSGGTDNFGSDTSESQSFTIMVQYDEPQVQADLSISITNSVNQISNGNILIYTLTAQNNGPSNALHVTFTDSIPTGLTDVMFSINAGYSWNEWTGKYVLNALDKQDIKQLLIKGIVQSSYGHFIENTAYISASTEDPYPANNEYSVSTKLIRPPEFSGIRDYTVLEDHSVQILMSAYDMEDLPCTMNFNVSISNADMISSHITSCYFDTYTITLNPKTNRSGSVLVSLSAIDSDGLSASDSFEVTFIAVNDPPSFYLSSTILEVFNTGSIQRFSNWAQYIAPGPTDESNQSLEFYLSVSNSSLFEELPEMDHEGTLTFKPTTDSDGSSKVDVFLKDNGGTEHLGIDISESASFTIIVQQYDDPQNQPPIKPKALTPDNHAILSDTLVQLSGSAFSDPDSGDKHMYSFWRIRPFGRPYSCSSGMSSPFCYTSTQSDPSLTDYYVYDLYEGMKYAWQVAYVDEGSGQMSEWSDELYFVIGSKASDTSVTIEKGAEVQDFCMRSFVMWPENPSAQDVLNQELGGNYNVQHHKIGTYDPLSGIYREFFDMDIQPGHAYWFLSTTRLPITIDGVYVSLESCITIQLLYNQKTGNGWNMIAAPNKANYDWYKLTVLVYNDDGKIIFSDDIGNMLPDNEYISIYLWQWNKGEYSPYTEIIHYNEGYWVETRHANVSLIFSEDARVDLKKRASNRSSIRSNHYSGNYPPNPMSGLNEIDAAKEGCFIKLIQQ
jgi:uncharacterized repeat protein (TIGR01451 family)